jgi:Mce-associated membrane protein
MTLLRTKLKLVLAVLVAVLVIVNGVLFWSMHHDSSVAAARQAAQDTARKQVVAMLSYSANSFDRDMARAGEGLTGAFKQEFLDLAKGQVGPAAKEQRTSTHTSVSASSVIDAGTSQVQLLMFLNQTTQSPTLQGPKLANSRVKVTLEDVDGRWLVSALTPL